MNVELPPFRAYNGVRLSQVVQSLSAKLGETSVVEPGAERTVGYAWTVARGPGATALDDLTGGAWWVAPDGVTHIGPRPVGSRVKAPYSVEDYDPADGRITFSSPEDDVAAFTIGGELAGEGIDPFRIGSLEVRWANQSVRLKAWRTQPPLRAIVAHLTRKKEFHAVYKYRVISETARSPGGSGGKLNLQVVSQVDGLPGQLEINKVHGLAGVDEVCAMSSLVLVGFEAGDPGQPFVAHYLPSTPVESSIDARTRIAIGESLIEGAPIQLGSGIPFQQSIALAPPTVAAINALLAQVALNTAALVAIGLWIATPAGPGLKDAATAACSTAGGAMSALVTLIETLTGPAPTGLTSNRTTSQ